MATPRAHADAISDDPTIRTIALPDLRDALVKGLDDFRAKPSHLLFLSLSYPIIMLILARATVNEGLLPLVFPIISGCALIGPFVAIGLYELSRRREKGLEVHWRNAFDVFRSHSIRAIAALGIVLAGLFVIWLLVATAIYDMTLGGTPPASVDEFVRQLFTTEAGWTLIVVGNGVGLLFAIVVLAISVVSFPLLLDRDVGAIVAVRTSIRAVVANPRPMAVWGLIVAGGLLVGAIPVFLGLAIVMPVLGHATWHLYRKVVET